MRSRTTGSTSALAVLLAGSAAHAQTLTDGFYRLSSDTSAPSVTSQDGRSLSLGPVQEIAVGQSRIYAEDNANSQFWINVGVPQNVRDDAFSYVLVVADRGYPSIGGGGGNDSYQISFRISGADDAEHLSRFLGTPVIYRKHPGHQLLVSFTPTKASFRARDEVTAKFRIENIGTNAIAFRKGGQYRGSTRDNQFEFSARLQGRQVPGIGTNFHMGGLSGRQVLKAGAVFEDEVSLGNWFAFDKSGRYEILGTYDLTFFDPDPEADWTPIWTDLVSSEFAVTID